MTSGRQSGLAFGLDSAQPICAPCAETPAVATAWASAALSTARTSRSRPCGVSRAFLWMFIRSSGDTEASQPQLPRSGPDGQPTESSQLGRERPQEATSRFTGKTYPWTHREI